MSWCTRPRIRSCSASAWPPRATSCRFFRHARADASGTPNPVAGLVTHSVAQGTSQAGNFIKTFIHLGFNEDITGAHRLGRRLSVHRRQADADELQVRGARWRRRRSTNRAASRSSGGPVTPTRARPQSRQPARSLHCNAHLPEGHRGVRLHRVLGTAHLAGAGRHRCGAGHPAARQRAPLLHAGHDAWRWTRRLRGRADRPAAAARFRRIRIRWPTRRAR